MKSRRSAIKVFGVTACTLIVLGPVTNLPPGDGGANLLSTDFFRNAQAAAADSGITLTVGPRSSPARRTLQKELFGINSKWTDSGNGIVDFAEMINDRSFRNQAGEAKQWLEFPNKDINGTITYVPETAPGTSLATGPYPGYMKLAQDSAGYTCITQLVIGDSEANEQYELQVSARQSGGTPALSAFFADKKFLPVEDVDKLQAVESGEWASYTFLLTPSTRVSPGIVRLCNVAPGSVDVDEVRLHKVGGAPAVKAIADARIKELGVQSLRWPAGTDVDRFNWKASIGPLSARGENIDTFGRYQTTSWGLHEFLDYAELNDIVPLMAINITDEPAANAELVEYILGPASSAMGELRALNGRSEPWNVKHFELGNEPSDQYQIQFSADDTSKGYIALATASAMAMKQKASELNVQIRLKAVVEAGFAMADWISAVPLLASWNGNVLDQNTGLLPYVDDIKGNFYSAFNYRWTKGGMFDEVMAGGKTLELIIDRLRSMTAGRYPFWITEYSLMVEQKLPTRIIVDRVKDFQSGLATADLLITAIENDVAGAYLYNLAEEGTWGVLANNTDFRLRPAGLAFSMVAQMAGETLLETTVVGATRIAIDGGDGISPADLEYDSLSAIASFSDSPEPELQLVILNRSYDDAQQITVQFADFMPVSADISVLAADDVHDHNEEETPEVVISRRSTALNGNYTLSVPARSLMQIVLRE